VPPVVVVDVDMPGDSAPLSSHDVWDDGTVAKSPYVLS